MLGTSVVLAGTSLVFGSSAAVFTGLREGRQRVASSKAFRELICVCTCTCKDASVQVQVAREQLLHSLSWEMCAHTDQAVHITNSVSNEAKHDTERIKLSCKPMPLRMVPSYKMC